VTDYLVFVGASEPLENELETIKKRFSVEIVANAVRKQDRGTTIRAIDRAVDALVQRIPRANRMEEVSRLSIWAYEPQDRGEAYRYFWETVGGYGWIQLIPSSFMNQIRQTRIFIEERYNGVVDCIHLIGHEVHNRRRRSPLPLPRRNFISPTMAETFAHWYEGGDVKQVERNLNLIVSRYKSRVIAHLG
jgi:hypothetical protein